MGTLFKDFIEININILYDILDTSLKYYNKNNNWPLTKEQLIEFSKSAHSGMLGKVNETIKM
jgi:hypothetical protein